MAKGGAKYHRVLLKMSGEALLGDRKFGISPEYVRYLAEEIQKVHELGVTTGARSRPTRTSGVPSPSPLATGSGTRSGAYLPRSREPYTVFDRCLNARGACLQGATYNRPAGP